MSFAKKKYTEMSSVLLDFLGNGKTDLSFPYMQIMGNTFNQRSLQEYDFRRSGTTLS